MEIELYAREIARKTGENTDAIRRDLQNLEDIGLLLSQRRELKLEPAKNDGTQ